MKPRYLAGGLSIISLIASSALSSAHAVTFVPSSTGRSAPSQATGGASRGTVFTPATNRSAPSQATGGASRGAVFTPATNRSAPSQATGGASRGDLFKPTTGNGAPTQAVGGASRVGTYYLNSSVVGEGPAALIALLPQSLYGTTVSERPTFLVYLPASAAEEAVFSLKDEAGHTQYQMTISVTGKMGVMAIQLPADAPALAVGKNYQWFLALKLDGELSPGTPYVDGWVQRIQPNAELAAAMQQEDALKRATVLGKNGVWYDCAATLASLRASQPSNATLTKHWVDLLTSVELKEITAVPMLVSSN